MTAVLRIDPESGVTDVDRDMLDAANAEFDGMVDVIRCSSGLLPSRGIYVGAVHDYGLVNGMPRNLLASVLYGRSWIHGPMYFGLDTDGHDRPELPDEVAELVRWLRVLEKGDGE